MNNTIENKQIFLISYEDLRKVVFELVEQQLQEQNEEKEEETFLTTKEACALLHVDRSTLWRWQELGILIPSKVGARNLYNKSMITRILRKNGK